MDIKWMWSVDTKGVKVLVDRKVNNGGKCTQHTASNWKMGKGTEENVKIYRSDRKRLPSSTVGEMPFFFANQQ
jgi:hypothetical protein